MGKSRLLHREQVDICMEGLTFGKKTMTGRVEMSRRRKTVRALWRGPDFIFSPLPVQGTE